MLRQETYTNGTKVSQTDYCGPFIYQSNRLEYVTIPGGRIKYTYTNVVPTTTKPTKAEPETVTKTFEYFITDHQGNVRVVYKQGTDNKPVVLEETAYYPFGMQIQYFDYNSGSQPYKYNGKEFINDNNLQWLSYGFRMQDPQLDRWHCPDALGEMYASTSPYAYCGNDPVNFTDFAGLTRTYNYATGQWEGTRGVGDFGYFTGENSGGGSSFPKMCAGLKEAGPKPTNKQLDDYIAACNNPYAPFKGSLSDFIALTNSPASLGGVPYGGIYSLPKYQNIIMKQLIIAFGNKAKTDFCFNNLNRLCFDGNQSDYSDDELKLLCPLIDAINSPVKLNIMFKDNVDYAGENYDIDKYTGGVTIFHNSKFEATMLVSPDEVFSKTYTFKINGVETKRSSGDWHQYTLFWHETGHFIEPWNPSYAIKYENYARSLINVSLRDSDINRHPIGNPGIYSIPGLQEKLYEKYSKIKF